MKVPARAGRLAAVALGTWFVASLLALLAAALVPAWPPGLELPWSGFSDFALHPRGEVLVYVRDYDRVVRYTLSGEFLGSFPAAGYRAGRGRIGTTEDGRIVLEHMGRLRVLAADGAVLGERATEERKRSWRLDAEGALTQGLAEQGDPTRPAGPGDLLFGGLESPPRTEFRIAGAVARRRAGSLRIEDEASGELTTIGTPWYLLPVRHPWPAVIPWAAVAGLSLWAERRRRRRAADGAR